MIRLAGTIAAALVLQACANYSPPASSAEVAVQAPVGPPRIAVASALGDSFEGVSIGFTVFNNRSFSGKVTDWHVDTYAENAAIELLRSNPRLAPAELDRSALSAEQVREHTKALWAAAERQGFTQLVLLEPVGLSGYRPGYGLFERTAFGLRQQCLYVAYTVSLYDVATRERINWISGTSPRCGPGTDGDIPFATPFESYRPETIRILRSRLEQRIAQTLRNSLEKLSLLPPKDQH
jgi:hypothetical protein